jgi:hypothetical protein
MMVICNGRVETSTANVAMLYYFNDEIYYKNTTDNWFVRTTTWEPSTNPMEMPIALESPDGMTISTVGPAITNSIGERWTLSMTGEHPLRVAVDGTPDPTTAQVMKLYYHNHMVFQMNSSSKWWSKTQSSDVWTATTDPTKELPASE